jgi:hypothetical protein
MKNKDKKMVVMNLKILNKKGGKKENYFTEGSELIPLSLNPVFLTGGFSVSLFLLKIGMLGCVAMDIASLYQKLEESAWGF